MQHLGSTDMLSHRSDCVQRYLRAPASFLVHQGVSFFNSITVSEGSGRIV
jgi:hypothetical protein